MVAGHLREKDGFYHIVLSFTDENSIRKTSSQSTKLPIKGNKRKAEEMLIQARKEMEEKLEYRKRCKEMGIGNIPDNLLFTTFLSDWLRIMKNSLEMTTYAAYAMTIYSRIIPYFEKKHPHLLLRNVTPKQIQDYYTYEMANGISANTVIHRHANIRKALQYAYKTGMIDNNPADRVQRPKKIRFECKPYNSEELEELFKKVKGTDL